MIWGYSRQTVVCLRSDEELVRLAHCGNRWASESLLCRYRPLVESKARAYFLMGGDHDDVVQEGMIGLYKAIRDFRTDRMSLFRAFADLCVTRQILTAVKMATRHKHFPLNSYLSLNCSPSSDPDAEGSLIDTIADPHALDPMEQAVGSCNATHCLDTVRSVLSTLEKRVLDAYLAGKTYREMSSEFSCLPKTIDNALQRVRRKIGESLAA